MSQVTVIRVLLISLLVVMMTGCGDPNTEGSFFDADSGSHISTWIYSHVKPAHTRTGQCTECHGEDFDGGMAGVRCDSCHTEGDPLTTPDCTSCHGAPPSDNTNTDYPNREGAHAKHYALSDDTGVCDTCHNGAGSGTLNHYNQEVNVLFMPRYNSPAGSAAFDPETNACSNVICHGGNQTPDWFSSITGCSSCHGRPPSGTAYPNREGAHAVHNALPAVTDDCDTCHNGAGSGTLNHANPEVDIAFLPQYNSPAGSAAFDPETNACSNVICHGGNTTPDWFSSITGCTACHGAPPSTGAHAKHNALSLVAGDCDACHNGAGSGTTDHSDLEVDVAFLPQYGTTPGNAAFDPAAKTCSNVICHGGNPTPDWFSSITGCTACHGYPPSGTDYPNREGAHAAHDSARLDAPIVCDTCHDGAGSGTPDHVNFEANVGFPQEYDSKSGIATGAFDPTMQTFTCSNVSCHGGPRTQTAAQAAMKPPALTSSQTPDWFTGSIYIPPPDPDRGGIPHCSACHVYGTEEYNSYFSGKHYKHVFDKGYYCDTCHNLTKLGISHFTGLNTPDIEAGAAAATLETNIRYNGVSCTNPLGCHGTKDW